MNREKLKQIKGYLKYGSASTKTICNIIDAILEEPERSKIKHCPNGLLPDGPICPGCGHRREPSGVGGGTWVHVPEPREPWPGEIAEARLRAELQTMTADRDNWRASYGAKVREIDERIEGHQAKLRDLNAQVEGLTVERDAARVGLANVIAERDALRARIEGAEEAYRFGSSMQFASTADRFFSIRYRLVPDPLPEVKP